MPSCAIITCKNNSQTSSINKGGISYHRFPKEPELKEKWIDVTGRENWFPTKSSTLCSKHFSQNDFIIKKSGNKYLKPGALPTEKIVHIYSSSLIGIYGTILDLNEVQKNILQWKNQNLLNFSEIGAASNGIFDLSDVKNKILQWKTQKLTALCPKNGLKLQNLLNLACSTAQPTNVTLRDACITCFSKVTSMAEGPQELNALSVCAVQYFTNTSYGMCATNVMALSTSALNVQPSGCYNGYCDFVKCLRRTNSINLITQCTREARTGVNITLDSDNVRFYTNVTSCILAKTRCGTFNPITGEPQAPGYTSSGLGVSNALQFSDTGELRILSFSAKTPVSTSFCTTATNLTQTNWLTNVC